MKPAAIGVLVLLLVLGVIGVLWVAGHPTPSDPESQAQAALETAIAEDAKNAPKVSPKGPWPKVVLPEKEFKFGSMAIGEKRSHKFVIENQGEAPLQISKGPTTCKCTLSKLEKDDIPVGEKVEIELAWEPKNVTEHFRQTAKIFTNDPKNTLVELVIEGEVTEAFSVKPPESWMAGEIQDDKPTNLEGEIISRIADKFSITEIKGSSEGLTAEAIPMTAEDLESRKAKSGYFIKATLTGVSAVGRFIETLTIKTDLPDHSEFPIRVVGRRPSPLEFTPGPGTTWDPERMTVDLGEFDSSAGKKARMVLFVSGDLAADFQFTKIDSDTPFVKVSLKKDELFKVPGRQRFDVLFEVPPGSPPVTMIRTAGARVVVNTNHPKAEKLIFGVDLISY